MALQTIERAAEIWLFCATAQQVGSATPIMLNGQHAKAGVGPHRDRNRPRSRRVAMVEGLSGRCRSKLCQLRAAANHRHRLAASRVALYASASRTTEQIGTRKGPAECLEQIGCLELSTASPPAGLEPCRRVGHRPTSLGRTIMTCSASVRLCTASERSQSQPLR
jgi:hypothetical protein